MKVGIMQPYLFPYIGYFQLINAVHKFVIHDDVQYIKGGWINRNRIQINDKEHLFTFSLKKDSSLKNINTRFFSGQFIKERENFLRKVKNSYKKTPFFSEIYDLLREIFNHQDLNLSSFIINSQKNICNYLNIKTPIYISSQLEKNNKLKSHHRVINICKTLNGDIYINPIGGMSLYSKEVFKKHNINLFFLKTKDIKYEFKKKFFIPNLSIIDVMMYNSKKAVKKMLDFYELV